MVRGQSVNETEWKLKGHRKYAEGLTQDLSIARISSYRMHNRKGKFSFRQVLAVTFVCCVLNDQNIVSELEYIVASECKIYLRRLQVDVIVSNLENDTYEVSEGHVVSEGKASNQLKSYANSRIYPGLTSVGPLLTQPS